MFAIVAVACKEDVALALAVMGVLIAWRGRRTFGAAVAGASVAWYVVATRVIIPWQNGIGPFYDSFFGNLGNSPGEIAGHLVRHPNETVDLATRSDRVNYYRMMLTPVAFLPLLALPVFLIGGPMLAVNVLSSFPYTARSATTTRRSCWSA